MILRGWKSIGNRVGRSTRWLQRWRASKQTPLLPVSFVNGRVEAYDHKIEEWQCKLLAECEKPRR